MSGNNPTVSSLPIGANSPAKAALLNHHANNNKLQSINQMGSGIRMKKGGAEVTVGVIKPIYSSQNGNPSQNGTGTDTTSQQAQAQAINAQSDANRTYDTNGGGFRSKYKKGGNRNLSWGCYSGGRRRTYRRKNRKNKKRTRRNRR